MFKVKQLVTASALVLVASGAMASNFRAADQVYVPAAGHLNASGGTFISDVTVSNLESESVTVSVIYTPTTNLAGARQEPQYFNDRFTLQPFERKEFRDFLALPQAQGGLGLTSAFGTLIFNACRAGASCIDNQDENGVDPDFRNIAVTSRIYFAGPNVASAGTTGQAFPGIPWYNYASMRAAQSPSGNLGTVAIAGFRQEGFGGQANTQRGNVGVMNASQFATTQLRLRLFQAGSTTPIGERIITLAPLNHVQGNLVDVFNTLQTGPTSINLYVTVEQISSTAEPGAPATCGSDGCPGFLAYGTVLDNLSGDGTTLEAIYQEPLSDVALGAIYGSSAGKPNYRRSVRR
jgi:hypothetical protein